MLSPYFFYTLTLLNRSTLICIDFYMHNQFSIKHNYDVSIIELFYYYQRNVLNSKRDQSRNPNLSAEVFNSYFSSIGKNVTKDISFNKHFELSSVSNRIFQFSAIPTSFIVQYLSNLKSNSSIDIIEMDVKLLIIASSIIAPSLAHVFNLSLSSGIVPSDLKLALLVLYIKKKVIYLKWEI